MKDVDERIKEKIAEHCKNLHGERPKISVQQSKDGKHTDIVMDYQGKTQQGRITVHDSMVGHMNDDSLGDKCENGYLQGEERRQRKRQKYR